QVSAPGGPERSGLLLPARGLLLGVPAQEAQAFRVVPEELALVVAGVAEAEGLGRRDVAGVQALLVQEGAEVVQVAERRLGQQPPPGRQPRRGGPAAALLFLRHLPNSVRARERVLYLRPGPGSMSLVPPRPRFGGEGSGVRGRIACPPPAPPHPNPSPPKRGRGACGVIAAA